MVTTRLRWVLGGVMVLGLALAQQNGPVPTSPALPPAEAVASPPDDAAPPDPAPDPDASAPDTPESGNPEADPGDPAAEQEGASITLTRKAKDSKERLIKIVRTGLTDDTGIFVACTPQDSDPPKSPTLSVFSETGPGGIEVTVDKNLIRAPLAVVTQQESGDGHIEMSAGTARYLDEPPPGKTDRLSRCAVEAAPKPAPDTVFVTQGRTSLKGQTLVYDESDGLARITGPITFERVPATGKPETDRLTGNSERIEVNVDKETTTLVGGVVLKNGARTSTADRVDYDDAANVAILRGTPGTPAESVSGPDTIRAPLLRYNLDRNTVVAVGSADQPITGEFEDGAAPVPETTPDHPRPLRPEMAA